MNTTKKLMCILVAGTTLGAAVPVFADSSHGRFRDRDRYSGYERYEHRAYVREFERRRAYAREFEPRRVVVVERPYLVERQAPVYYPEPASAPNMSVGALIGAAIGGIIDNR